MCSQKKSVARTFIQRLGQMLKTTNLTDPRKRPVVQLSQIMALIISMPLFSCKSLFDLDYLARNKHVRKLLGSKRYMVGSDSTIQRVISQIIPDEVTTMVGTSMKLSVSDTEESCYLDTGVHRSIGIVDGTCVFGSVWFTVLARPTKTGTYAQVVRPMKGRGHELRGSEEMLLREGDTLPQLLSFDGLYLCEPFLHLICAKLKRHILVKFRSVKRDGTPRKHERLLLDRAARYMEHQGFYSDAVQTASGYDYQRSTSYQIEAVPDEWHGVPVLVLRVTEGKETFWVITSDVHLSLPAAREAAHLRWSIENDEFKRMSYLTGTKRVRTHNKIAAVCLLCCIAMGVNFLTSINHVLASVVTKTLPVKRTWKITGRWIWKGIKWQIRTGGMSVLS